MSEMGPPLPQNCAACVFYPPGQTCRRHAPSPGTEEFDLVYWPRVSPTSRCGSGAAATDGEGPGIVLCQACVHWYQPPGGIKPYTRQGKSVGWWTEAGWCQRFAPSPSSENDRKVYWKATNGLADGCGDGQAIPQDEEEDEGDITPTSEARSTTRAPALAVRLPAPL